MRVVFRSQDNLAWQQKLQIKTQPRRNNRCQIISLTDQSQNELKFGLKIPKKLLRVAAILGMLGTGAAGTGLYWTNHSQQPTYDPLSSVSLSHQGKSTALQLSATKNVEITPPELKVGSVHSAVPLDDLVSQTYRYDLKQKFSYKVDDHNYLQYLAYDREDSTYKLLTMYYGTGQEYGFSFTITRPNGDSLREMLKSRTQEQAVNSQDELRDFLKSFSHLKEYDSRLELGHLNLGNTATYKDIGWNPFAREYVQVSHDYINGEIVGLSVKKLADGDTVNTYGPSTQMPVTVYVNQGGNPNLILSTGKALYGTDGPSYYLYGTDDAKTPTPAGPGSMSPAVKARIAH